MNSADRPADLKAGRRIRPAAPADIGLIRALLAEAIDASPFYNDAFKAHEKARFSADFLLALISTDPWYVPIIEYRGEGSAKRHQRRVSIGTNAAEAGSLPTARQATTAWIKAVTP